MTAAQEPPEPVDEVDVDEIAEEAPIDPTPQEVDAYRSLIGDGTPGTGGDFEETPRSERRRRVPEIPEF